MHNAGNRQIALRVHIAHAAQRGAANGGAVIGVDAADQGFFLRLALRRPEMPRHADHGVVGFRAGIGQKHMVELRRGQLGQQGGQLDHRRVSGLEKCIVKRQFQHLLVSRLGQLLAAIAEIDAPQPGHAVDDALAFRIPDAHAFAAHHHPAAQLIERMGVRERMQMMGGVKRLPRLRGAGGVHDAAPGDVGHAPMAWPTE